MRPSSVSRVVLSSATALLIGGCLALVGLAPAFADDTPPTTGSSSSEPDSAVSDDTVSNDPVSNAVSDPTDVLPADPPTAPPGSSYNIVAWSEDDAAGGKTFPQTYVANVKSESIDLTALDSQLTCGTYQVDAYADDDVTDSLIKGGHLVAAQDPPESFVENPPGTTVTRLFTDYSGCTPSIVVDPSACTASTGSARSVTVVASGLVKNQTYTVEVKYGTTTDTFPNIAGASATWTSPRPYLVPIGDSITATVTNNSSALPDSSYAASDTELVSSCPALANFAVALTHCATVGGQGAITLTSEVLMDGTTYSARVSEGSQAVVSNVVASGDSITVPVAPGSAFTVSVMDAATHAAVGAAQGSALSACPEVAASSITASGPTSGPTSGHVASLAVTGVDPVGPAAGALVAVQLGCALMAVAVIRRRRTGY